MNLSETSEILSRKSYAQKVNKLVKKLSLSKPFRRKTGCFHRSSIVDKKEMHGHKSAVSFGNSRGALDTRHGAQRVVPVSFSQKFQTKKSDTNAVPDFTLNFFTPLRPQKVVSPLCSSKNIPGRSPRNESAPHTALWPSRRFPCRSQSRRPADNP